MRGTKVEIFDWLIWNEHLMKHDLAGSNIRGVSYSEFRDLAGLEVTDDFDLGVTKALGTDAIIEFLTKKYKCVPDNIVTTTGASEANFLVYCSHLGRGDEIIMERPGYSPMWLSPQMIGAKVRFWDRTYESGFALDIGSLKRMINKKTKLVVFTNLHNPSGVAADYGSVKAVSEIAGDNGAKVLIDEMFIDGAFEMQMSAAGLDSVIVTESISKIYGLSGLRTGWIIADPETAAKCMHAKALVTGSSGHLGEYMVGRILNKAADKLVGRFLETARTNFDIVSAWMGSNRDIIGWVRPDGGVLSFPKYTGNMKSVDLCEKVLKNNGVLLSPGEYFNLDGHFRMSYRLAPDKLKIALDALSDGMMKIL